MQSIVIQRRLIGVVFVIASFFLMAGAALAGVDETDERQIRSVIEQQIQAFRADDGDKAFSFASPDIQRKFGSVESFMSMVKGGYRAVYRPQEVEFLGLREQTGAISQAVRLVGPDGKTVMAVYTMERQDDGGWKIDGVYLVPLSEESA